MINYDIPFNLVRKSDRRQSLDRRSSWRGSRRISDLREFGQLPVTIDAVIESAPEGDVAYDGGLEVTVAKYLH